MIVMPHKFRIKVIAEEIKTGLQKNFYLKASYNYVQSYLFSRSVSPEDFDNFSIKLKAYSKQFFNVCFGP